MKYILDSREMKSLEESTQTELSSLMERAAQSVCDFLFKEDFDLLCPIVLCGPGNNGGDGLAIASILKEHGISSKVVMPLCEHLSPLCALELERAKKVGVPFCEDFEGATVIVDALFGIGQSRQITSPLSELVKKANSSKAKKVAVDIPSGLSSDTGEILGCVIAADATVTFQYEKTGHLLSNSLDCCGKIYVADIGVKNDRYFKKYYLTRDDLSSVPLRRENSNKGDYKKVLAVVGSKNMCGAAYLVAMSAYRSGAGLVKVHSDEANRVIMQTLIPEALFSSGKLDTEWADVVLIGSGLGKDNTELVRQVMKCKNVKKVIDADALNIISEHRELMELFDEDTVITPHMGEMSRLTGMTVCDIKRDPVKVACDFHDKYRAVCLLKDARSIIACDSVCINRSGNSGMAKGGSGDVLCGIIGGLLALGLSCKRAAELGAYIAGLAGDEAAKLYGRHSMIASDCVNSIYKIFQMKEDDNK